MKTALVVNNNRVASCFAGNELWIYDNLSVSDKYEIIDTAGWEMRDWVTELYRRDIERLLCAGIDRFLYGSLQGNGIIVIQDMIGEIDEIKDKWRRGLISDNQEFGFQRRRRCGRGKKRCRNNG